MTKNQFYVLTRGQFNSIRKIEKFLIREQAWARNPWQIVDIDDFDSAGIIQAYRLRDELWEAIKNKI